MKDSISNARLLESYDPLFADLGLGTKLQAQGDGFNSLLTRLGGLLVVQATYDFAVQGGAVGDIVLPGGAIPAGTFILGGVAKVLTALGSGGSATAALKAEAAGDIIAATVISGAPWSTTGRKSVVPAFTGATIVETTVARNLVLSVAVAALNAGKLSVTLFCVANAAALDALVVKTVND